MAHNRDTMFRKVIAVTSNDKWGKKIKQFLCTLGVVFKWDYPPVKPSHTYTEVSINLSIKASLWLWAEPLYDKGHTPFPALGGMQI